MFAAQQTAAAVVVVDAGPAMHHRTTTVGRVPSPKRVRPRRRSPGRVPQSRRSTQSGAQRGTNPCAALPTETRSTTPGTERDKKYRTLEPRIKHQGQGQRRSTGTQSVCCGVRLIPRRTGRCGLTRGLRCGSVCAQQGRCRPGEAEKQSDQCSRTPATSVVDVRDTGAGGRCSSLPVDSNHARPLQ